MVKFYAFELVFWVYRAPFAQKQNDRKYEGILRLTS